MTTKNQLVSTLKTQYPTIRVGSDEVGYTELVGADYEAKIAEWADNLLELEADKAVKEAAQKAKEVAQAKLEALGLTTDDLKALGL